MEVTQVTVMKYERQLDGRSWNPAFRWRWRRAPLIQVQVDSGLVGVEKPDPRIFQFAFDAFDVGPANTVHLGDIYATDVLGARAAGCRIGLIDPFDHYEGRHLDVPRVAGAPEVARAIATLRTR